MALLLRISPHIWWQLCLWYACWAWCQPVVWWSLWSSLDEEDLERHHVNCLELSTESAETLCPLSADNSNYKDRNITAAVYIICQGSIRSSRLLELTRSLCCNHIQFWSFSKWTEPRSFPHIMGKVWESGGGSVHLLVEHTVHFVVLHKPLGPLPLGVDSSPLNFYPSPTKFLRISTYSGGGTDSHSDDPRT